MNQERYSFGVMFRELLESFREVKHELKFSRFPCVSEFNDEVKESDICAIRSTSRSVTVSVLDVFILDLDTEK